MMIEMFVLHHAPASTGNTTEHAAWRPGGASAARRKTLHQIPQPEQPSPRTFPERLPPLEYPGHFEVRRVSRNGGIRWKKGWVNISSSIIEQNVGLEEVDDGVWSLYFGSVLLGRFHEDDLALHGARLD